MLVISTPSENTKYSRQNNDSKDIYTFIYRLCECVTLHGKRDFEDVIKVKVEMGEVPESLCPV